MSNKYLRRTSIVLAAFFLLVAILFSIAHLITPWVSGYRTQIEQYASQKLGRPVTIAEVQAGWYYFEPVIRLSDVNIDDNNAHTMVTIGSVGLGFDLFSSFWHWRMEPGVLVASQVNIHLDSSWVNRNSTSSPSLEQLFPFIATYKKIILNDLNVDWVNSELEGLPSLKISEAYLKLKKSNNFYYLKTEFNWQNKPVPEKPFVKPIHVFVALDLSKNDNTWMLNTEQFFIGNSLISANTECILEWPNGINGMSDATIQLSSQFALHDLPAIRQYLPDNLMKEKLRRWLHRSIIGGTNTTGNIILKGRLADFPFDNANDSGLFLVDSDWNNFTLDYKEGWPAGKNMNAHVTFKNRDLTAAIHQGTIDQLPLSDVKAQILGLGLGKETLEIQGHLAADATKARHFILNSPLKTNLSFFQNMELSGPSIFDIAIQIPLYPENDTNLVDGKAIFLNNDLILKKWWNLDFQHFKGEVTYNQSGIVKSQFKANLLNYPLSLRMRSVQKPTPATIADVKAKLGIDALKKIFPLFVFDFMKGATSYTAQLVLTSSQKKEDHLILNSSLQGIAINLPKPYGKTAKEKRPLALQLYFSDDANALADTRLHIDYDKRLSMYLGYQVIYHGLIKEFSLKQGKISLGGNKASKPETSGLSIEGTMPEFSVSAWMPFLNAIMHKEPLEKKEINVLQSVEIVTPKIVVSDQIIHNANVSLYPQKDLWMLNIKSDEISGAIQIPSSMASGISAHLDYVHIDGINSSSGSSALQPGDIPSLNLQINDFRYRKINLGKTELITRQDKKNGALVLKEFIFQAPATSANFRGKWQETNEKKNTSLIGAVVSNNIQQTLKNIDIEPVVQGQKGSLNMKLNWPDSLFQFSPASLNGSANLRIEKGVITHLSKSMEGKVGLGKLMGILSLQTLPRRLTLDFSDLSEKGLSFDVLKGSFILNRGRMTTTDMILDGPVADISMKGEINIAKKLYDLVVNISPQAALSIPVIATIAGGPVVGLAALAATTLINQGMKQSSIYRYQVKGPWDNPKVTSV